MEPTRNHDRGSFEGKVCADLEWIKREIGTIQSGCIDCTKRIREGEIALNALVTFNLCSREHEVRLRGLEQGLTQVKAVGGILGTLGGILASVGIKLWGSH